MTPTDHLKEADAIRDAYTARSHRNAFEDAVIAFLWLFVRIWISKKKSAKK
jgi:hypothetical protein